ncbi:ArsR/SmtB family transcription factor [Natrinema ejinorense]|uniref:Transcriptional regulator n=1 Tax=Natrinema ejinorense TaxID=373386 RepID=A0A2A5R041_9EURY|nr:winged helix-turn-helix domain-containing protein [Natrinema ejinorense]PCR92379.1 transcriptional regulator [Natrinema ejinorense]
MNPADDPDIDQDTVDAIGALGNRTRLEILLALANAQRDRQEQWLTLSFTELYEAIDVDSTSQFSYHLDRLVGPFVAETPTGYRLTDSGAKIVRTVRAGVYESAHSFAAVELAGVCVVCETPSLVATVEKDRFVVRCRSCESTLLVDLLSRSQTRNRSATEIVDSVGHRIWSTYVLVRGGVCPECYGPIDTAVATVSHETDADPWYALEHTCRECWFTVTIPLEVSAAFHPAAIGFFWAHGISLLDTPLWEFFEFVVMGTITTDVTSVEPLVASFELTLDDETMSLRIDDSFAVTVGRIDGESDRTC